MAVSVIFIQHLLRFYLLKINMIRAILILSILINSVVAQAQRVDGKVFESTQKGKEPLIGANVLWAGTTEGTTTDENGYFSLNLNKRNHLLVFSYVGYQNDTLHVHKPGTVEVVLSSETNLDGVVIRGNSVAMDRLSPIQNEIITTKALAKAACCNLSESFETNASISVSYSDAVTGSKQIQMLGLSGAYIQTVSENIPSIRGLAGTFGLNFIPGTWIQSIDIGKGAGSIVNGYEGMTGQINVELQKPDISEKLYLNTYVNNFGRGELNLNLSHKLNDRWSTGILSHASTLQNRIDKNGDGFLDLPLYTQYNLINRWKYQSDKWSTQFGVKALKENRLGGQTSFEKEMKGSDKVYGFGADIERVEVFSKIARMFPDKPYKGIGLIMNASDHKQESYFGQTPYNGRQKTLYGNLIYQSIIGTSIHSYKTGISYLLDDYNEMYKDTVMKRTESVPGVFAEYTFNYLEKFVMVAGARVDRHNMFGTQFTPRLHLKYSPDVNTTFRASAGRGFRTANPLAEYYGNLVSSRDVIFKEQIRPEVSWNYGVSATREFFVGDMKGSLIVDYYRTDFQNQLVADMETSYSDANQSPGKLMFYNLDGKAFANSFQAELNLEPLKRLEVKLAYRYFDVKHSLHNEGQSILMPKMMTSKDRVLFNAGYALPYDKWKFDVTVQWNGKKRMPYLGSRDMHEGHTGWRGDGMAPSFYNVNAQITRTFPVWDIYLGGENLTNFRQMNPILGASDPFGYKFDGGMAWGPVTGRMVYLGFRYKINRQ